MMSYDKNGPYFLDDTFKCIFLNENVWITIKILLIFLPIYSSIGSDNGLALIKRQAIIWTIDG